LLVYFLYGLFILACIVLVVAVLLQPGKADAGALFTSSISSTAFGPRGTQTVLAKITIGAAVVFMLVALMLSLPALTGSRSVLQSTTPEATPTPAPAASPVVPQPAAAPSIVPATNPSANTNTAPASNNNKAATKNTNDKTQPKK
jgi:preprotein translocase subunit SecG